MRLYKYIIVFFSLVVCSNLSNNCFSQAKAVALGGPRYPVINRPVTYYIIFKDANGNVLNPQQVGVTQIWWYSQVNEDGPNPIVSQTGLNYNVTWRTLGFSEVDCTIFTWDNYLELGNTAVNVRPQPDPLMPGCSNLTSQTVYYQDLPEDINASPATGGDCFDGEVNNYVYQWQWSTDNVFFQDIPNTTAQNLHFTNDMYFANHQSPGTTIYIQRKATCGTEVQYTNKSGITYTGTPPIYARLELAYTDLYYDGGDDYYLYERRVGLYIRFYSDKACTIHYQLPASVSFNYQKCTYYEHNGTMISNNCASAGNYTAPAGSWEYYINDGADFDYYYEDFYNSYYDKYVYDYVLISAGTYNIKPTVTPPHFPTGGGD